MEGLFQFLPFIAIFVLFYFMLIRPQMKQAKEHRSMLDSLKKGDEVVLSSGIIAKINSLSDQFAIVEIAKTVEMHNLFIDSACQDPSNFYESSPYARSCGRVETVLLGSG